MAAPPLAPRGVWIALAIVAVARLVSLAVPSMAAWGLNVPRFVDPAPAGIALGALALSLLPPVAAALARPLAALGDALVGSRLARVAAVTLAGLLVWSLADWVWFLGDFMLRQGAIEGASMETIFEQSLPLDLLFHALLPRTLSPHLAAIANTYSRLLGAVESGVLAWLALRLARGLGLGGSAALAAAAAVFFGGHLAFLTGFAKPAGELCLFTLAVVVFGASLVKEGRGGVRLGIVCALAFGFHRSALALAPAWLFALGLWWREHRGGRGRMGAVVALLLPSMMLIRALPLIARIARDFDLSRHLAPEQVARAGGPLAAAFQPQRLLDLANLALVLAPIGIVGVLWLVSSSRRASVEARILAATFVGAIPFFFVHPQQGVFRDWDVFAPVGMALCLLSALAVGGVIRDSRAEALAAPVLASVSIPTLLVLLLHHDIDQGLRRAQAFLREPPPRTEREQALLWDFLGNRAFRLGRWDLAAEAFSQDDRFQPTRRVRLTWAMSETMRGNHAAAARVYEKLLATDARDPIAWVGLGGAARRTGDTATFRRAAPRIDAYLRLPEARREIRRYLGYYPQAWPAESISVDSLR